MSNNITKQQAESRVYWDVLEEWVRRKVQELVQAILEEEVAEFLGRRKWERREPQGGNGGYRNGYGEPRKLTLSNGRITLRRPRVRDADAKFESRVLPLFATKSKKLAELIPELYLHGLAEGDFDLALRGLLGDDAPVSASTVARLKEKWQTELEEWQKRPLSGLEVVYVWADGVYVKAGLEKAKAAVLVVIGALTDGRKTVLAVVPGYRESTESWSEVLRALKRRGLEAPKLVVGDGNLGIWGALRNVYPEAAEQRCWNHKIVNVMDKLPKREQAQARVRLCAIPYAQNRQECERMAAQFIAWCREYGHEAAAQTLERDWERMVSFYDFPKEHWQHLRTTNPVESPFAALRLRTDAAKRYKRVDRATAVIWKMLLIVEKRFRRLNAPELLRDVYIGARYMDGLRMSAEEVA